MNTSIVSDPNYLPSPEILQKYADVLVKFALNSGKGVQPGEVVMCAVPDIAMPLAKALQRSVLESQAHPIIRILPSGFEAEFYDLASPEQLKFFPKKYFKAQADMVDHQVVIIADVDPYELKDTDPKKIMLARNSRHKYREWLVEKEVNGKFTWTAALWGVAAKAAQVGLSLEEYWEQIIKACFLDIPDPLVEWRKLFVEQERIKKSMNALEIEWVHIEGPDVDLKIQLGADRIWQGGSGRNIPSFELFTSPDWRGTEGWIKFNQPLYRYGNVIDGIELTFAKGKIVKASAKEGEKFLKQMIKTKNANQLGEFSLTDARMSRITHVMAETLFDENIGGEFGNTHVAIGNAYKDCYRGDGQKLTRKEWLEKGYNESAEHCDMVSTTDRTVTATLTNGKKMTLYKNGQFQVE